MHITILFIILISGVVDVSKAKVAIDLSKSRVFDRDLYNQVIDSTECLRQITYLKLQDIVLLVEFLDAGVRFPRGITMLSTTDLGHYEQCLAIHKETDTMKIEGKYALFTVPLNQTVNLPFLNQPNIENKKLMQFNGIIQETQKFYISNIERNSVNPSNFLSDIEFIFAACMPKSCTLQEWIQHFFLDLFPWGFKFGEISYRLPNDKPWVAADYVAIAIFSTIALITVVSTSYDINHIVIKKRDPKEGNMYYRTFSVYTNTRQLLTFTSNPKALNCLDGIRCLSMMWVILGHGFSMYHFTLNSTETIKWMTSGIATIITSAVFAVDSFLTIAGLLLVYTTVGKLSGPQLLKRLHLYYLNRILRMFPLLATLVLLEASVFHRIVDGPYWTKVAENTQACRSYWWSTLLHIQNYFNPNDSCIRHSWYIAIDIQLHIISPLILYWVLSKNRKVGWAALTIGLLTFIAGSTTFNFIKKFPSSNVAMQRLDEQSYYMVEFYINTLCRGSAFFIGMITGYILSIYKGKKLRMNITFVLFSWIVALLLIALCLYASYEILQMDWDNQLLDTLYNSFMRVIWCTGLSWIIFACAKGYGGPIDWFLSLSMWKLPSRISFAMYLYHYSLMFMYAGAQLQTTYFSLGGRLYDFMAFFMFTFIVAFVVTVVIDAPFAIIIKMLMERGQRCPRVEDRSQKPGTLPVKDFSKLENDLTTTVQNNHYTYEKNKDHLEGNGSQRDEKYLEKIITLEREVSIAEKSGHTAHTNELIQQVNGTSNTNETAIKKNNGSIDRPEDIKDESLSTQPLKF